MAQFLATDYLIEIDHDNQTNIDLGQAIVVYCLNQW